VTKIYPPSALFLQPHGKRYDGTKRAALSTVCMRLKRR